MCITMRVPWLTIDRLGSCRDIRFSAATMRALNSRRPRSTVSISRLVPRSALCFLLLLCVLHDARARSVSHDDDGADQVHDKISEAVEVSDPDPADVNKESADQVRRKSWIEKTHDEDEDDSDEARKISEEKVVEDSEKIQTEDEGSVAKKRRRNDVTLPSKSAQQDVKSVQKDEGIRRFDSQVELDDTEGGQRKASDDITENISNPQADNLEQKKLIDVNQSQADVNANPSDKNGADSQGEKKEEIPSDLRENLGNIASLEQAGKADLNKEETGQIESLAEHNLDEARIEKNDKVSEEVRNDLRSLELAENANENEKHQEGYVADEAANEEIRVKDPNREDRHLSNASGKPKYKSSTVYLNAEERNLPGREQESIVNGQIKKLISIRDDALETIESGAKQPEKLDEESFISETSVADEDEEVRSQRSSNAKGESARSENLDGSSLVPQPSRFQQWKDQAALIQDQIKNRTFLQHLREQATEVLPNIPKFTEIQLLETLRNIVLLRKSSLNETYSASLNATELSENQLEIIKCAEQLVETKQRQTFVQNMGECIRGLSVLNCMRIFVWPVVLDNLPDSVKQSLNGLPLEINLIDLFQSNRAKSARSESGVYYLRLLTPEYIVFTILKGALESKATYDLAPTYIDSQNETLRTLLTIGQLQILQMAERLLPAETRREYSDRMFSCVRRFEYFSCVKYFAWPMVKRYHPALPAFPDYPTWYPSLYPQYPIVPFPSFVEGELPEVVEADATRMRKPEAVIVNILHNALQEQVKTPFPSVTFTDSYVALLPPEQLLSIHMAEQLLPAAYRSEFVQKTVRCIQEFNYLTCIRYSTWPTVKQFSPLPSLPDWIPSFSDFFGYFPGIPNIPNFPGFPDFSSFLPGGGNQTIPPSPPAAIDNSTSNKPTESRISTILLRSDVSSKTSSELENKITEILTNVQNSLRSMPQKSQLPASGNIIFLRTITDKQINILKLAESIVPPAARAPLVIQILSCLQTNNNFVNCTRYIIWPTLALYVSDLPEFPDSPSQQPPKEEAQQTLLKNKNTLHQTAKEHQEWDKSQSANSNVKIISRTKFPQSGDPVISVTGTRFVPIFTEHPESVILNILRSIQLSSPNVLDDFNPKYISTQQQFGNLLNDQQLNIVKITESLLPDAARPAFVNRMLDCVRKNNFLECSRDLVWPTLSEYFPRLPSFPNFGYLQAINNKSILPQNLTDPSPLSETDVKVGQHGDATVTITDTRFIPIFSEHPEGVILKILTALQHTTAGTGYSSITSKSEVRAYFTNRQTNIIQVAESLLPESARPAFVEKMVTCIRESPFLECTRTVTWPTIAQFFPRLPNFPNFGGQTGNINLSSILLRNAYAANQASDESNENTRSAAETMEEKIESVLTDLLDKESAPRIENSYLDANNLGDHLTAREANIVKLAEKAIPEAMRRAYVSNLLECVKYNSFVTCTQHVTWPTVKQFSPSLPNFDGLLGQFPIPGAGQIPGGGQIPGLDQIPQFPSAGQFPGIGQIPDFVGQIPSFPGIPGNPFAEGPSLPQIPSFPQFPGLPQFPGGSDLPQIPGLPQFPGGSGLPQIPGFPGSGGISSPQLTILSDAPQEPKPQELPVQSRVAEQANQISGVSRTANTPSVDGQGIVSGYFGQPTGIFLDISNEKVQLSDIERPLLKSIPTDLPKRHERRRRSAEQLSNSYYETSGEIDPTLKPTMDDIFPNITESEFLRLLINITKNKDTPEKNVAESRKEYFVDTLNATVLNSLTADQYEILKITEDLNEHIANRGFFSRLFYCFLSLSFMKCMGIFIWPMVINNVPSIVGLPFSAPTYPPSLAKSIETEVENYFGMSTGDFEKELLTRKESIENVLLDWYKKAMEEKFQTNWGFLKIRGYGNGEVGISFGGYREGRATKIKDNKNLPSILTIISDIMEEVLDQRPDSEKLKKEKEKRERSLDDMQEADFQFLKESDEYADIKRSINDDQIIKMFLDKIKANATDFADGNVAQFLNEDAYNAFGVLFGTRLNEKFTTRLKAFSEEHLKKNVPDDHVKELSGTEELIPLKEEVAYDFEKESTESQEEQKREHRAKNELRSLLNMYSDKLVKSVSTDMIESPDNENKIRESSSDENTRTELRIYLPRLREDVLSRKITSTMIHLGRAMKTKMSNILPGIGFIITFFIQMALAHARAAASIAGMISNIAFASAIFGMIRQNVLGDNPKIKYVYDNDKVGPGITWPSDHNHGSHHGK